MDALVWAAIFIGVCLIPMIIITSRTLYELYCNGDALLWISKSQRNLIVIIMISFTLTSVTDLTHITLRYINPSLPKQPFYFVADGLYFFGNILFYILVLLVIALPFEMSKWAKRILSFIIFIFAVTSIVYLAFCFLYPDQDIHWAFITTTLSIEDIILSPFILLIFICKMKKTIIHIDPTLSIETEQNVDLMSNVITKHVVLFGMAMIVNQGFYTAVTVTSQQAQYYQVVHYYIAYMVRGVENVTNIFILWLILRINYDKYIKYCKCCHKCIGKCCFKNIANKSEIDNPYRELSDL